ncbi:glycosyltransferase [Algoriphagus sp. AGSA1]|uniref:glycosyltransferase n=1 Tax=Algoriphagus sp. AGSA1 TaxID=2907213 RepID=UPI001F2F643D|nr:glycosyltransferase [Algoriphagus sp. AGSA1]MCE7057566.1 glycosyltransferase [Algoriphagus sp. AGSA1]
MKIYKWIDKYNKRYCYKINNKYYRGRDAGNTVFFRLHPNIILYYLIRLIIVLAGTITLKKSILDELKRPLFSKRSVFFSPDAYSAFSIRMQEFLLTLFGYRFFVSPSALPQLSQKEIMRQKISFPKVDNPEISVIIPVFNQLVYTFNCLKSLENNIPDTVKVELILVDDCSTDDTPIFLTQNVSGITYIRNEENKGFLMNCNIAARLANGKYIYFLNNDTQVTADWLNPMLKLMEDEQVGCVGSKLIYAHGLLQEAGGIIYQDASGANYGRNDLPDRPRYNYIREVDYCSGASLLLRKSDFEKLELFDQRYIPAYYEDTDLCFAVRNVLKKKVMFHPLSEVIHFEGVTSGKTIKKNTVKAYQEVNREKFQMKWQQVLLEMHGHRNDVSEDSRKFLPAKRLLFIDDIIPAHDRNSGSYRAFQLIRMLKESGYHITFVPDDANKTEPYFSDLVKMEVEVLYRYPNRPAMIRELNATLEKCDVIWISRPQMNMEFRWLFKQFPNAKWIYDTIDLHHIRLQRQALQSGDEALFTEAARVKIDELKIAEAADLTLTVTEDEKVLLEKEGIKTVAVIPNIHDPIFSTKNIPFDQREGLLFIGAYNHPPNVDAAQWLVNEIMPKVWEELPEIKLTLLGSKPSSQIYDLASERVIVPGYVTDVSDYFKTHKLFVAPLRFGAGMKGKIGQSLAYQLPVITSTIGSEGMNLRDGKNVLTAANTEEFAKKIILLYNDEILWNTLFNNSHIAIEQFSYPAVKRDVSALLDDLLF